MIGVFRGRAPEDLNGFREIGGEMRNSRRWPIAALAFLTAVSSAWATNGEVTKRVYVTRHIDGSPPKLDGRPTEAAWDLVEWAGDFVQHRPFEGQPPSQPTAFKILYDDEALYVAYRAGDSEPEKIESQLARRDWFPGDWVEINIDSRGDRRTAFSFTTSASGVRGDEYISEDGSRWDSSWDPVWRCTTAVDSQGWTAEICIPLSQLRYADSDEQTWGIQVQRRIFRREERSLWQFISQDAPGWVSFFGELQGIRGIHAQKQVELLPYFVGYYKRSPEIAGDPFATGEDEELDGGLDGKFGLSGNMILDFTVNPDFGQVEADPAEVNLSVFETRFSERRPFFIEGNEVLRYSLADAITGGAFTADQLFYSRRIGRPPGGTTSATGDEYVDVPAATTILSAAKLSGKTPGGLSIGALQAVTAEERATIRDGGPTRREVVEPLTSYFVGRVQKEYAGKRTLLGGMLTATNRRTGSAGTEGMHTAAYAGGLDFEQRWRDRSYVLEVKGLASLVRGSRSAILATQTASAHYFQRPDAKHVEVDSMRTALSGHAGSAYIGKVTGRWRFQTGCAWRSPGFEINDLGYMRAADEINHSTWAGFRVTQPFSIFHNLSINANDWFYWDFGGRSLVREVNVNSDATFRNEWYVHVGSTRTLYQSSNTLLRGGPSFRVPGATDYNLTLCSDSRKALSWDIDAYRSRSDDRSGVYTALGCGLTCRPTSGLQISLSPSWSDSRCELQYVGRAAYAGEPRYLLAEIASETAAATFRIDACITPSLTIQYYAQPYLCTGRYTEFKRVTDPQAALYRDRFHVFVPGSGPAAEIQLDSEAGLYRVDENLDGVADYSFAPPDFNYKEYNSNLVLRWEYRPGSTLFLVWSQGRTGVTSTGELTLDNDLRDLFDIQPDNVFVIKVSRWLSW